MLIHTVKTESRDNVAAVRHQNKFAYVSLRWPRQPPSVWSLCRPRVPSPGGMARCLTGIKDFRGNRERRKARASSERSATGSVMN